MGRGVLGLLCCGCGLFNVSFCLGNVGGILSNSGGILGNFAIKGRVCVFECFQLFRMFGNLGSIGGDLPGILGDLLGVVVGGSLCLYCQVMVGLNPGILFGLGCVQVVQVFVLYFLFLVQGRKVSFRRSNTGRQVCQPLSVCRDLLGMGLLRGLQCGDIFQGLGQFGLNGGDTLGDCCKVFGQFRKLILPALNKCSPLNNQLFPVVNFAAKVGDLLGKLGDFLAVLGHLCVHVIHHHPRLVIEGVSVRQCGISRNTAAAHVGCPVVNNQSQGAVHLVRAPLGRVCEHGHNPRADGLPDAVGAGGNVAFIAAVIAIHSVHLSLKFQCNPAITRAVRVSDYVNIQKLPVGGHKENNMPVRG